MYNDTMYEIIKTMINKQLETQDYDMIDYIRQLIHELADTINCPYNWRDIGERLAKEYSNSWIYAELSLWDYEKEEY